MPVLLRIPFDRRIAQCYSRGEPISAAGPEYAGRMEQLFEAAVSLAASQQVRKTASAAAEQDAQ